MSALYDEYRLDLQGIQRILSLTERTASLRAVGIGTFVDWSEGAEETVTSLKSSVDAAVMELPMMNGVLLLFLAGRFENYVRDLFEDLCSTIASSCGDYSNLPKDMKINLIKYTAMVMESPRKYGHAENGVKAFVSTLARNLDGVSDGIINSQCLSITTQNMRAETLTQLFGRIGAKDVVPRIGAQAPVQTFFQVGDPVQAASMVKNRLDELMDLRNQIAHPSTTITWPSAGEVAMYIDFCDTIGGSLDQVCGVYAGTLGTAAIAPASE